MDILSQKKLLIKVIVLLAILNIFSIGAYVWQEFFHKPPPQNRANDKREVSTVLEKELNLTSQQVGLINDLRSKYSQKEKILSAKITGERDSMNTAMFNKVIDEELVIALALRVADNEYEMELLRFEQAKEFKSICTPDQLEKFGYLIKEIRDYFKPDNKPEKK